MLKTGDKESRFCRICHSETDHVFGDYKALQVGDRLFESTASFLEVTQKLNQDYVDHVHKERDGELSQETLLEFLHSSKEYASQETNPLLSIVAPRIRAFRCERCGSLIPIQGLP